MKKTVLLFSIVIIIIFLAFSASATNNDFSGGSGTENDPYLIETTQQLNCVRNNLNAYFKLISDIEHVDDSIDWTPIGDKENPFSGVFDGNGHSIKKLYISSSEDYVGLFGYNEGTIKNLSIIDADVYAAALLTSPYYDDSVYAGTIAGYSSGDIHNCCSFGKVYATATNPGTPTPETYYYNADVFAGGIVGFNNGVVENCYNNSSVTSKSSYQPFPYAGGIAGISTGIIRTSYNLGDISYNGGGIIGKGGSESSSNCYYLDNASKGVGDGSDVFTKCTLSSMSKEETFNGFDFTNIWTFDSKYGYLYPVLKNGYVPNLINTVDFVGGCGTENSPYLIETKEQLNNIRKFPKAHYKLISDIVFTTNDFSSQGEFYNNGNGWEPIGTSDEPFSGYFDGNGYTIKGLYINLTDYYVVYAGLFGCNNGTIKNLGMIDCNVTAKNTGSSRTYAGSISGSGGSFINCYNTGNIMAYSPYIANAGGIAGSGGNIEKCYNTGRITATASSSNYSATYANAYAGGIVGSGRSISSCYNTGSITGSAKSLYYSVPTESCVGGIAGHGSDISDSFNIGTISSTTSYEASVGGICGLSNGITNCYNIGDITSKSTISNASLYTGGISGNLYSGIISNCYYLDSISVGEGFGIDTCIKCISCNMTNASTYLGFDFDKIWEINKNGNYPLPVLKGINNSIVLSNPSAFAHSYTNTCDSTCNNCSSKRTITHDYAAATCTVAKKCKVCGVTSGSMLGHSYSNACDTTCNRSGCGVNRSITHSYKATTTKATLSKNGKVVNKCSVCGYSKITTVYYPKSIKLSATSYTYNGKTKTPTVTVKDSKGNTLKKDTDYTVKYSSGRKSTGKYSVTVTFKGKYSGTKTLYFNILPSKTSKITPTCATTSIKASWSKVTGASGYKVELLNSKGKVVKSATTTSTSYTFKSLSKVTTYKVRVTAYKTIDKKAVYSTVSTTITTSTAPAAATLSKVTAGSKSATPTWKKVSGASGYQVMYSTSSKFKSAKTATISKGSSTKTTIKKLTKGKTYYFKVRAYKTVDGNKVYGAWSSVKSVKVK